MAKRLLPEWHPQDAVQLTWPGPESDWAPLLERIEATLETLVVAIARYQRVLVSVPDTATRTHLVGRFSSLGVPAERLTLVVAESDDTWARDHGPLAVEERGELRLHDYVFTGWGGKFPAARDNTLTRRLADAGVYACPVSERGLVLEGSRSNRYSGVPYFAAAVFRAVLSISPRPAGAAPWPADSWRS